MIVVDSSAIIEVLLRTDVGVKIEERIFSSDETLHAPHLIDLEIVQVIRRYCLSGEMAYERGNQAIDDFLNFPIARYPHDIFLLRVWELRHNMTAYDAVYVALSEILSAPLLTRDTRLASASGHSAQVELI